MGASFQRLTFDGKLTKKQLCDKFDEAQSQCRYENGHSYSGGIGMARGLEIHEEKRFPSLNDAEDWLSDHAAKWDAAKAVRAVDDRVSLWNGGPNPNHGQEVWIIGATCAS